MKNSAIALIFCLTLGLGLAVAQGSGSGKLPDAPAPKAQTPAASAPKTQQPPAQPATPAQSPAPFKDQKEKISYALGMNLGVNLKSQSIDVDPNLVYQGLKDFLAGGKTMISEDESRSTLIQLQSELRAKQEQKLQEEAEADKKEGDAFLAANKAKEGVVTLPSGLQYKVLSAGTGPKPGVGDTVVCNYKGTLINGTEFDSSYKRGEPTEFQVNRVIPGWTEALQLMPVGSKWQLFVPSNLAYGPRANGPIPPNSTLIFEVELISIKPKQELTPK